MLKYLGMKDLDVCDLLSNNSEKFYRVNCGEMLTVVKSRMFLCQHSVNLKFKKKKKKLQKYEPDHYIS